ncbi:MAG: T9SS type A sorting domain-containing protein, partial [Bacteroidota bacterium]
TYEMKNLFIYFTMGFLLIITQCISAQSITFAIANKVTTTDSVFFDVTLASTSPFKLGSGLLYFNYNTAAFGPNVVANNAVKISFPTGAVLGQVAFFPVYTSFIENDNTSDRFAFSFQQGVSSGTIPADNITSTPAVLFRVAIAFTTGGNGQADDLCFESSEIFDDQFFTACGPDALGSPDCFNFPGTQLADDVFECNAALPVELVDFWAQANRRGEVELSWQTETEINNDYFVVEHATEAGEFQAILRVDGAGTHYGTLDYAALHPNPVPGNNYYRLKQVDYDGTFTHSDLRRVIIARSAGVNGVEIYPNPTTSFVRVDFTQALAEKGRIELFNWHGQQVRSMALAPGAFGQQLDVDDLPRGTYLLRVDFGEHSSTKKLVLQ